MCVNTTSPMGEAHLNAVANGPIYPRSSVHAVLHSTGCPLTAGKVRGFRLVLVETGS